MSEPNLLKSWVNNTRKIIGWKREKKTSIGLRTSFFIDRTKRWNASEKNDIVYRLLRPNMPREFALLTSSTLILFPVCLRKTSSRVGEDTPIVESLM